MLRDNRELFEDLLLRTSEAFEIDSAIIEKDYYVSLLLAQIQRWVREILFKGGTSLSKCYHLIDRFSEDIDLSIFEDEKPTESQRRNLKHGIIEAVKDLGFQLDNEVDIRSRREFNRYIITYPSVFESSVINQKLIVETAVFMGIYPTEEKEVTNYLYEYANKNGLLDVLEGEEAKPFMVRVQCPERTFVDKVFALGDYYLDKNYEEHSRHIYDLYKLSEVVVFDDSLRNLIIEVREERKGHKTCLSAQEGIEINTLLMEILDSKAFADDYNSRTYYLLFKDKLTYDDACVVLKRIVDAELF